VQEKIEKFVMDNKDFSVVELKGKKYRISKLASQVDIYAVTMRVIGEYVGKEFGHKMRMLVLYGKGSTFAAPTLDASVMKQDEMKWSKYYDVYIKKKTKYDDEMAKVFGIILGQFDKPMQNKVEGHPKFAQMEQDCNVAALLEVIKESALIPVRIKIQHAKQQMRGSSWHIATSRRTKQLSSSISSSWRQWIGQNGCMGPSVMLTRVV
jgi:hypothetical protein